MSIPHANKVRIECARTKSAFITIIVISITLLLTLSFAGCSSFQSEADTIKQTEIKGTELELHVRQTIMAQQPVDQGANETLVAQQATLQAQAAIATSSSQQATIPNQDQTAQEKQATQIALANANATQVIAPTPQTISNADLEAFMKSANILLYEDMIGRTDTIRYVKKTLETMGLNFKDDGSAQGWLKEDLTGKAPNGKPWDLVIIAAEDKAEVSGEFFTYVSNLIDQGTSAIMEVWFLDRSSQGTAQSLLGRCGLQFQLNWVKIPPASRAMFPLALDNPILREPNSGMSFTRSTDYWWDSNGQVAYDIGDLMKIVPGGDATLLLGTKADDKTGHGTVAVCLGGQLILQTFSSHALAFESVGPLWQNYIYNALKVRMQRGS
jgi:hypothetical protein